LSISILGFEAAIEIARQEVQEIMPNPAPPDFANTIVALDLGWWKAGTY